MTDSKMQQIANIIEQEVGLPAGSLWIYFAQIVQAYPNKIPRILERIKEVLATQ